MTQLNSALLESATVENINENGISSTFVSISFLGFHSVARSQSKNRLWCSWPARRLKLPIFFIVCFPNKHACEALEMCFYDSTSSVVIHNVKSSTPRIELGLRRRQSNNQLNRVFRYFLPFFLRESCNNRSPCVHFRKPSLEWAKFLMTLELESSFFSLGGSLRLMMIRGRSELVGNLILFQPEIEIWIFLRSFFLSLSISFPPKHPIQPPFVCSMSL